MRLAEPEGVWTSGYPAQFVILSHFGERDRRRVGHHHCHSE